MKYSHSNHKVRILLILALAFFLMVSYGYAITITTDEHSLTYVSTGAFTGKIGVKVLVNDDFNLTEVCIHPSFVNGSMLGIYDTGISLITNRSISQTSFCADFQFYPLEQGTSYYLLAWNYGNNMNTYGKGSGVTYPIADILVDWTGGYAGGAEATTAYAIVNLSGCHPDDCLNITETNATGNETATTSTTELDLSDNLIVHIIFVIVLWIVFAWANSQRSYGRLAYSLVGILLYFYNAFIQSTLFDTGSEAVMFAGAIITGAFWIGALFFIFTGIYYLFKSSQ